jgi:multiple sugar transport system substrate-binding protein
VEGVSVRSKNQLEAWKFLKFLAQKESLAKLYENQTKVRPIGTVYSRADMINLLAQDEYLGAIVKQADNFLSLPLVSRTFDNGLNDEIIKYLENAINSTIQGVSYEEAFNTAKKGVDQVINKYYQ